MEFFNFTTPAPPFRTTTTPLDTLVLALKAGYCASSFWLQNRSVFWELLGSRRTPSKWSASDTRPNRWKSILVLTILVRLVSNPHHSPHHPPHQCCASAVPTWMTPDNADGLEGRHRIAELGSGWLCWAICHARPMLIMHKHCSRPPLRHWSNVRTLILERSHYCGILEYILYIGTYWIQRTVAPFGSTSY